MIERKRIHPAHLLANGLWNHFTGRKRYSIRCGQCEHSYTDKVLFSTGDRASSLCPACGAQNVWSHSQFERDYNREIGAAKSARRL